MYRYRWLAAPLLCCCLALWQQSALGQGLVPSRAATMAALNAETVPAGAIRFEIFSNRPESATPELVPLPPIAATASFQPAEQPAAAPPAGPHLGPQPGGAPPPPAETIQSQAPARMNLGTVTPPEKPPAEEEEQQPGEERPLAPKRGESLGTIKLPKGAPRDLPKDAKAKDRKVEAEFGDGLTVKSDDGFFSLTFHNLTQADGRFFKPTGDPLGDSFVVPRQRWYVLGNVSKNIRYYTVINRGYGSLDLLDAFVDMNFGLIDAEKFQIRAGRMKTPYTYEYIKISETDLIAPERSVFVGNLAPNREVGAMAHGDLLERRFEYALGVFNGPRRSFQDFNSAKDFFSFVNLKPFRKWECSPLQQLNLGGSFNCGDELNPLQPAALRTANDQSPSAGAANVSPTFLQFGPNVFEDGWRMQWSGDVTWYYKSFGLLAGYQGGFQDYGKSATPLPSSFVGETAATRTRVPMTGWSLAMFYFITGEQITRRVFLVEPRSEFTSLKKRGTGAIELFGRFANLRLGNSVFTGGLVDQNAWSNQANVTDLGVNWYPNHYIKLTFDYQYADFEKPVTVSPTKMSSYTNLYWLRAQLFF